MFAVGGRVTSRCCGPNALNTQDQNWNGMLVRSRAAASAAVAIKRLRFASVIALESCAPLAVIFTAAVSQGEGAG